MLLDGPQNVRTCPECGKALRPRQKFCSNEHRKAAWEKARRPTTTHQITAVKGRSCANCRRTDDGVRFAFWWDDWDREARNVETAMVLCSVCWPKFSRQKAREDSVNLAYELRADGW